MIKDLKELAKLITLCQKQGVESIKLGDIELKIDLSHTSREYKQPNQVVFNNPYPSGIVDYSKIDLTGTTGTTRPSNANSTFITANTVIPSDSLTEEQLLFYSVSDEGAN
jgi:hypothetical protein